MGLQAYLTLAAIVFCIGLFGVITRRNTIGILLERNHLCAETQFGAQFFSARLEQRFQQALRDEDALGWTDVSHAFIQVRDKPRQLLPCQGFDGHNCAVLDELVPGFLPHDLLNADGSEDLHGPLADLRGARMDGRTTMLLDH